MMNFYGIELRPHQVRWEICDRCAGHGKHDNPAFSNGFTSDEWSQMDYDEREDYLSGTYDVICTECKGLGRVALPARGVLTFAQRRELVLHRRSEREYQRDYDSERWLRMAENGVMG